MSVFSIPEERPRRFPLLAVTALTALDGLLFLRKLLAPSSALLLYLAGVFAVGVVFKTNPRRSAMSIDSIRENSVNPVAILTFSALTVADGALLALKVLNPLVATAIFLAGAYASAAIVMANQWEKAVILRMGRFVGLKGPGLFLIFPIFEQVYRYIDQRVRVTDFKAEETLTRDTVPVNVDAVVYWMVWDAEKAALEVKDYEKAVYFIAQTSLRDTIGKHDLADLLQNRQKIAAALQETLDEHTNPWGITCQTVGIKDIVIPSALADAMSKQAQAERERQARIILGTAETEISEKFARASENYTNNPVALQLRGMNMLFEGLKEKGSLIIVPSSALESMNLGAVGGLAALSRTEKERLPQE